MFANGRDHRPTYKRIPPAELRPAIPRPMVDDSKAGRLALNFINAMKANGFMLVNDMGEPHYWHNKKALDYLLNENELLFKRKEGSNFFVLAKMEKNRLLVHFTNPDSSEQAFRLKSSEVVRLHEVRSSGDMAKALNDVITTSAKKPKDVWTLRMHGHLGYITIGGEICEIKQDDGVSKDRDMMRNMVLANYDIDATGYHNAFVGTHFQILSGLEASVGILKVPSVELTLPLVEQLALKNGPHHLIHFANPEVAAKIQKTILEPKTSKLPGMAPDNVVYEKTLEELRPYAERGEIAISVAHPAAALPGIISAFGVSREEAERTGKPYGGRTGDCGVINAVASGALDRKEMIDTTVGLGMAVAAYNLTVPHTAVNFVKESDWLAFQAMMARNRERFLGERGVMPSMTQPALSMAFAFEMASKFGLTIFYEDDKHSFHPVDYKQWPGALMRGWNEIRSDERPTAETVVKALRLGEPFIRPVIFFELKEMKVDGQKVFSPAIINERKVNGLSWKLGDIWSSFKGLLRNARGLIESRIA